jgi:hypothetical protein
MLGKEIKLGKIQIRNGEWTNHIPIPIYKVSLFFIRTILRAKRMMQDAR